MRRYAILMMLLLLAATATFAAKTDPVRWYPPQPMTGLEDTRFENSDLPPQVPARSLDDPISPRYQMGTTWYDLMSNGSVGRQIAVDAEGWVHSVWTNGLNSGSSNRHVYYNVWDPEAEAYALPDAANPVGVQVDASTRAGFTTVAVRPDGFAFPAYHQIVSGTSAFAAVSIDFLPRLGGFAGYEIPHLAGDPQIIWPKVAIDVAGTLHIMSTQSGGDALDYYCRAIPQIVDGFGETIQYPAGFQEWESAYFITSDVATSYQSPRVAVAWNQYLENWTGVNVLLKISEDGGLNWGETIYVTNYPVIDTNCVTNGGDVNVCNGDTVRPNIDLSVLIDDNDNVHVAFTCHAWFYWWPPDGSVGPFTYVGRPSSVWHWDEVNQEYNIIADQWILDTPGTNQVMVQRPSLGIDTLTGKLYCAYQQFDTSQYSDQGLVMADAYVTVSEDHGRTWAVGTNVTNTNGGQNTPAPGSRSERGISIHPYVTNGMVHLQYMLDYDAGSSVMTTPEGVATLNPLYYQPVPTTLIPERPLVNPYRALRQDSTGYPWGLDTTSSITERPRLNAGEFALYQNYPNPFNPTTQIQFDLGAEAEVTLRVFNVVGQEVATLLNGQRLTAGAHVVPFTADNLASGVYLYRLETPFASKTKKMILMR